MNASFEQTVRAQAAKLAASSGDAQKASESDGARARIESLLERTHDAIDTLQTRLEPVLHQGANAAESKPLPQATTPIHAWLLTREESLQMVLGRLRDILDRLEV